MKGKALRGAPLLRGVIAPTCVGEILQASHAAPRGEDLFARLAVSEFITPLFFAARVSDFASRARRPSAACEDGGLPLTWRMAPGPVT